MPSMTPEDGGGWAPPFCSSQESSQLTNKILLESMIRYYTDYIYLIISYLIMLGLCFVVVVVVVFFILRKTGCVFCQQGFPKVRLVVTSSHREEVLASQLLAEVEVGKS